MAFVPVPQGRQICLHVVLQYYLTPLQFAVLGVGVLFITVSLPVLYVVCLLLCRSCSVSPQFFWRKGSRNRYRFGVSVEELSSGSSYDTILDCKVVYFTVFVLTF